MIRGIAKSSLYSASTSLMIGPPTTLFIVQQFQLANALLDVVLSDSILLVVITFDVQDLLELSEVHCEGSPKQEATTEKVKQSSCRLKMAAKCAGLLVSFLDCWKLRTLSHLVDKLHRVSATFAHWAMLSHLLHTTLGPDQNPRTSAAAR